MAVSLEDLPPEIIEIIYDFCNNVDEHAPLDLRATSRILEAYTRRKWHRQHFLHRYIALNVDSLTELVQIASQLELAKAIRSIRIYCDGEERLLEHLLESNDSNSKADAV